LTCTAIVAASVYTSTRRIRSTHCAARVSVVIAGKQDTRHHMRDTWEGFKIVWRREPRLVIAVVCYVLSGVLAVAQMVYALLTHDVVW
jgi:hypothetical protein